LHLFPALSQKPFYGKVQQFETSGSHKTVPKPKHVARAQTSCNDVYVTEVILENLKDRAVTIFSIYLKIGHNYYVELENLEEKPLVLKAFETYRREFGPIEFYGINNNKIRLNDLLGDRMVRRLSVVDL
jgi:hypothetical protein